MEAADRNPGSRDSSEKLVCVPCVRKTAAVKPPNKRKHEEQLAEIQHTINLKEHEKKTTLDYLKVDREKLQSIKSKKDEINSRKDSVFGDLDKINREVQKKGEKVQKLRGGIVYQTEFEIEQQVRKLMYQIQRNNFKLAEEKRIVSEIDRLNRSKKNLKEYLSLKQESDSLRNQQRALRADRENFFRELRDLRREEDCLRASIRENSSKVDRLKEDIDHFFEERRSLINAFREHEQEYRASQRLRREQMKKKLSEEREQREAEDRREREELRALQLDKPYDEEQNLCKLLINYCESLLGTSGDGVSQVPESNFLSLPSSVERRRSSGFSAYTPSSECSSKYATPLGCSPATTPLNATPPTSFDSNLPGFYKKKDEDTEYYAVAKKKTKKSRAERKMSLKKCISHNPETFLQFSQLDLSPPTNLGEVRTLVELLKTKLKLFQKLAKEEKDHRYTAEVSSESADCCPMIVVDPCPALPPVSKTDLTLELTQQVIPELEVEEEDTQICDNPLEPAENPGGLNPGEMNHVSENSRNQTDAEPNTGDLDGDSCRQADVESFLPDIPSLRIEDDQPKKIPVAVRIENPLTEHNLQKKTELKKDHLESQEITTKN